MNKEALKLAEQSIKDLMHALAEGRVTGDDYQPEEIEAFSVLDSIKEALAQPEQEPVAWAVVGEGKFGEYRIGRETESNLDALKYWTNRDYSLVPLYTTPPKRPWVGLTEDEMSEIAAQGHQRWKEHARAIEAKLKDKNTAVRFLSSTFGD